MVCSLQKKKERKPKKQENAFNRKQEDKKMVKHVILWQLKDSFTEEEKTEIKDGTNIDGLVADAAAGVKFFKSL